MRKNNYKKAFTIVEILIAIAIIAILGAIFSANYKVSSGQVALDVFHRSLSQDIELAKWKALDLSYHNGYLPAYWGVNLSQGSNEYAVFADLNANSKMDNGEREAKINKAKSGIYISNINLANNLSILFPTEGGFLKFYDLDNNVEVFGNLLIEIRNENLDIGKLISVNSFSLVELSDCFCSELAPNKCSWCP